MKRYNYTSSYYKGLPVYNESVVPTSSEEGSTTPMSSPSPYYKGLRYIKKVTGSGSGLEAENTYNGAMPHSASPYYKGLRYIKKVTGSGSGLEAENTYNGAMPHSSSPYYKGLLDQATSPDRESVVSTSSRRSFMDKMQEYCGTRYTEKAKGSNLEARDTAAKPHELFNSYSPYYKGLLKQATSLDRESVVSSRLREICFKLQEYQDAESFSCRAKDDKPPSIQDFLREKGSPEPTSPRLSAPLSPEYLAPPPLSTSTNKKKKRKSRYLRYQGREKADPQAIDPSSPYFIHPFDYPWQMQVNDVLTNTNYSDWSQEMANFLFARNKMGFIDGSIPKPQNTEGTYMAWLRSDEMIKGWLITAMEKDIQGSVKNSNSASEIWNELEDRFKKRSVPRASELKQTLMITRQDGASISTYFTKFRSLWEEIQTFQPVPRCTCMNCSCDLEKRTIKFIEKERVYKFIIGLDAEYSQIRSHLLSMKNTPTLGEAYRIASEYEQQRSVATLKRTHMESETLQTYSHGRGGTNSRKQKSKNIQKDVKRGTIELCNHCGKVGHNKEGWFEKIGYPDWWPGKAKREKDNARSYKINRSLRA